MSVITAILPELKRTRRIKFNIFTKVQHLRHTNGSCVTLYQTWTSHTMHLRQRSPSPEETSDSFCSVTSINIDIFKTSSSLKM